MDPEAQFIQLTPELYSRCKQYIGLKNLSEKTKELYLNVLTSLFKKPELTQATYAKYWSKGNMYKAVLNIITSTCHYFGFPSYNYKIIKSKNKDPIEPVIYSEEDILTIANKIECYGLLIKCAYYIGGGLRFSSAIMLRWDDFNWEEWVENQERTGKCRIFAKGGKYSTLDVDPVLMKELHELAQSNKRCFLGIPYKNYSGSLYIFIDEEELKKYRKQIKKEIFREVLDLPEEDRFPVTAELKARNMVITRMHKLVDYRLKKLNYMFNRKIKFHSIRHSKSNNLAASGFEINEIKDMLMHKSIVTTQIYVNTKKSSITEKYNKMLKNKQNG